MESVYERRDILKKLAYPISLRSKKTGETLCLGYNKKTGKFGVSFTEKGLKDPTIKRDDVSDEEILPYISENSFETELEDFFERVKKEEEDYTQIKKLLLEKLEKSKLVGKEKEQVRAIVEELTNIPYFSIGDHRIAVRTTANKDYETRQYLRVGNEYDRTKPIALQFVTRVIPRNGTTDTNYRKTDFDEMVSILESYGKIGVKEDEEIEI